MRPFFVTAAEARKQPRWLFFTLCFVYVLPGFVSRDPWRNDDAASFGVVTTMLRGNGIDWLRPNIFGVPVFDEGPMFFWLASIATKALPFLESHFAVRLFSALLLALALLAVWYATYTLARRPEAQPADPFRLSATPIDFARAVADISVLVTMSCFGIVVRAHETTSEVMQLSLMALYLLGAGYALAYPRRGALVAGIAIGLSTLTKGPVVGVAMIATTLLLPLTIQPFALVRRQFLSIALAVGLGISLAWPIALWLSGVSGKIHLVRWALEAAPSLRNPTELFASLGWTLKATPWYLWPLWPVAIWTVIRWRGAIAQPVTLLPILLASVTAVLLLLSGSSSEANLMMLIPPLAVLAAIGLPTLSRSLTNLLDWLAVMIFTTFGFIIWAYYLALASGFPAPMAKSAARYAAGYDLHLNMINAGFALALTVGWLALVYWRMSGQRKPIWRTITLSGAGLALVWGLLMSLWLPVFNHRKTYRDVGSQIMAALPSNHGCVSSMGLSLSQRAILGYFVDMKFAEQHPAEQPCEWLLIADKTTARIAPPETPRWQLLWKGARVADRQERVRLFRLAEKPSRLANLPPLLRQN
jgi:4-amino-4-deoxy-L-arabinose transferase-like glycosyltransferase